MFVGHCDDVMGVEALYKVVQELRSVRGELHLTQFALAHLLARLQEPMAGEIRDALNVRAQEWMNEIAGDSPDALVDERVANVANMYLRMLRQS